MEGAGSGKGAFHEHTCESEAAQRSNNFHFLRRGLRTRPISIFPASGLPRGWPHKKDNVSVVRCPWPCSSCLYPLHSTGDDQGWGAEGSPAISRVHQRHIKLSGNNNNGTIQSERIKT